MPEVKRRGRPPTKTAGHVCELLLAAAEESLRDKQFKDITVREVAALAGVNAAMINYYFNNKEGLFVALIEFLFVDWENRVQNLIGKMPEMDKSPSKSFVELVDDCYYRHALIIKLLSRELAEESSGIQQIYQERLASRTTIAIGKFITAAGEQGFYRKDLDINYASLAMASVAIHPISISPSSMQQAYNIEIKELRSQKWLDYLTNNLERLFSV